MIPCDIIVTAVSERAYLFVQTMDSLLAHLDAAPARVVVHEDVIWDKDDFGRLTKKRADPGGIGAWLAAAKAAGKIGDYVHRVTDPAQQLGPALLWCLEQAATEFVFYTQEDWLFVRDVPMQRGLETLVAHGLNHVRFNKRKTMRAKHADTDRPWHKIEVEFPMPGGVERWCISDHWYSQASLWRVAPALEGVRATAHKAPQGNAFMAAFNHHMNMKYIGDVDRVQEQMARHAHMKTYIYGPVAEPQFIKHLGSAHTTGPIKHIDGA